MFLEMMKKDCRIPNIKKILMHNIIYLWYNKAQTIVGMWTGWWWGVDECSVTSLLSGVTPLLGGLASLLGALTSLAGGFIVITDIWDFISNSELIRHMWTFHKGIMARNFWLRAYYYTVLLILLKDPSFRITIHEKTLYHRHYRNVQA